MCYSIKYQKQNILFLFGIREKREFDESVIVVNYPKNVSDIVNIQILLQNMMDKEKKAVLIKVPKYHKYKLPNLVVENEHDIKIVFKFLSQASMYAELWICIKEEISNGVSGRIAFDWKSGYENQFVELIAGTYPRKLEAVNCGEDSICIWERHHWNTRYKLLQDASICDITTKYYLLGEIERRRQYLDSFCQFARHVGILSISFDYVINAGKMTIIDWDSEDDIAVISKIENVKKRG